MSLFRLTVADLLVLFVAAGNVWFGLRNVIREHNYLTGAALCLLGVCLTVLILRRSA